jgi:hypothetical protein
LEVIVFRKLLFTGFATLTILAFTNRSHAETHHNWLRINDDSGSEALWVDTLSEKTDGEISRLTVMVDYGLSNGHSKGSIISDFEVKCHEGKFRVKASAAFQEEAGQGKPGMVNPRPTPWVNTGDRNLPPEIQAFLNRACTASEEEGGRF